MTAINLERSKTWNRAINFSTLHITWFELKWERQAASQKLLSFPHRKPKPVKGELLEEIYCKMQQTPFWWILSKILFFTGWLMRNLIHYSNFVEKNVQAPFQAFEHLFCYEMEPIYSFGAKCSKSISSGYEGIVFDKMDKSFLNAFIRLFQFLTNWLTCCDNHRSATC